VLCP
jgi:hypothetical protein